MFAKNNQFELGCRFYGPDAVFEKNTLGLAAGYSYLFDTKRVLCGPNLSYIFFTEKKSNSTLLLHEISLGNSLGYKIGPHFSILSIISVGIVHNKVKSEIITTKQNYFNYEFALGLTYYFGNHNK